MTTTLRFRNASQLAECGLDEIKREYEAIVARQDYLLRCAESASRDMTADEKREFDALEKIVDGVMKLEQVNQVDRRGVVAPDGTESRAAYREGFPLMAGQTFEGFARSQGDVPEEHEGLSLQKALKGVVTGEWDDDRIRNAMVEGTTTAGGYLLPTVLTSKIIDLARNQTRVLQAGATVFPMSNRTVDLAKWAGDQTAAWHTEAATITASDATLAKVTLTAQALTSLVVASRELLEDADGVEDELRKAFAAQFAIKLDLAALYGTGTPPEPRGVKNASGITTVVLGGGANGATPSNYDFLVDAKGTLADNNEQANAVIYSPRTARTLAKLKDTTNQPLQRPQYVDDLDYYDTNQIGNAFTVGTSTDTSDVFTADWSKLIVGVRTNLQIQVLQERYADAGEIGFLAWFRGDVLVARGKAFHVTTGVRP